MRKLFLSVLLSSSLAQAAWWTDVKDWWDEVTFPIFPSAEKPKSLSPEELKNYNQIQANKDAYNKKVMLLNATVKEGKDKIAGWEKDLKTKRAELKRLNSELPKRYARVNAIVQQKGNSDQNIQILADQEKKERELIANIERDIQATGSQIQIYETGIKSQRAVLEKDEAKLIEDTKKERGYHQMHVKMFLLEKELAEMKVGQSFTEFRRRMDELGYDIEFTKDTLERKYDESLLKEYMMQKFKKLLNSKLICEAANPKQCNPDNTNPTKLSIETLRDKDEKLEWNLDRDVFNSNDAPAEAKESGTK